MKTIILDTQYKNFHNFCILENFQKFEDHDTLEFEELFLTKKTLLSL